MARLRNNFQSYFSGVGAKARATLIATALLVPVMLVSLVGDVKAATAVGLGTADSFVVLAGSGITNTGATTLNGDMGTFPTLTITGSSTITITGTNHGGDSVTQSAKTDLVTAYNSAAGQTSTNAISGDLGGQTLVGGVYTSSSSIGVTGALTLNGGGDANSVFIFQAGSTLTTASGSSVVLTNGAQACNVFWQVGSSATLGTGSSFVGTIIALTSITLTTGATVSGRALARNGAVTMDTNTITRPSCAAVVATTTTTTVAATTTTVVGTTTTTVPQVIPPVGPVTSGQGTAVGSRARISELEQVSRYALAGKPMVKSVPLSLQIPAIGVNTKLVGLGLASDGTLAVTKSGFPASWYTGAPTPGQVGPAIITGHSTWSKSQAVFYRLGSLRQNDLITVGRQDGSVATFRVTKVELYAKSNFPTKAVYGNIDHAGLRLITCGGYSIYTGLNEKNIVVYAELFSSASKQHRYY
ncbi:MAG: ice-binding family protein [Ilumatobacteraceae bacterium]